MSSKDIGYLVKSIDEKLKVKADTDLKSHNLTLVQSFVLTFLYSKDGQATQKEIEDYLDVSHPAVVGIVSRMEQNNHVTTWMNPNNKRIKMVQLTPQAQALGDAMNQMRQQWEDEMLQGISPEDATQLKKFLSIVNNNLTKSQSR